MNRAVPDRETEVPGTFVVIDSNDTGCGVVDRCPTRWAGANASTLMAARNRADTVSDLNKAMVVDMFIYI